LCSSKGFRNFYGTKIRNVHEIISSTTPHPSSEGKLPLEGEVGEVMKRYFNKFQIPKIISKNSTPKYFI